MTAARNRAAGRRSHGRRMNLDEAVVLLTGATGGLGTDLARELHRHGARIALVGRSQERLAALAAELGGPDRALALQGNVEELAQLEGVAARTADHFGRIDVVIAGAGTDTADTLEDVDPRAFERDIDTNLTAVWRTFRATLPYVRRTRGHLVAVSSLAAFVHSPMQSSYAASKAGVVALCDSLRLELAGSGVTVGSVHPTFFDTPMQATLRENAALTAAWGGYRGVFTPVDRGQVVKEIVRSINRRARTTVVPRRYSFAALAPGLLQRLLETGPLRPQVKGNPHA
ncbi:Short-chain dehydrogenase/reductase SDR [Actinomyces succiniciruminis]|uniref:Short-chain dehydrogenase/reductase SDR n=2 Tax=Actinomyces succiniciruminis TaxID=1522002 RepID=A0A1L7RDL3_9ACTO|nr:Short-chain dehydrogenase/reductase SDR [Actinomyces succiniciruminis]